MLTISMYCYEISRCSVKVMKLEDDLGVESQQEIFLQTFHSGSET